jgi:hypothetical protein
VTKSVKKAAGSSRRCIEDNASLAQAFSSVNDDFQEFEAACLVHSPTRIWVLISITDRRATDGAELKLPEGIAVPSSAEHSYLCSAEVRVSAGCIRRTGSSIAINSETVTNL